GDEDLDLYLGNNNFSGGPVRDLLYLNDGTGVFTDASSGIPDVDLFTLSARMCDVDGDEDLDVFVGGGQKDHLLLNDGSGSFTASAAGLPELPPEAGLAFAPAFGDMDGDLDQDLL